MTYVSKPVLLILMIAGTFGLSNCKKEKATPNLCFSYIETSNGLMSGEEIEFTNCSSNSNSSFWDFGDGHTSTQKNPIHTYDFGGTYEVKLTISNSDGGSKSGVTTVEVLQSPPKKMVLHKITLVRWPETNANGDPWDNHTWLAEELRPDIVLIIREGHYGKIFESDVLLNAKPGTLIEFSDTGFPVSIDTFKSDMHRICWFDRDDNFSSIEMGCKSIYLKNIHQVGQTQIEVIDGEWEYVMDISWNY